MKSCRRIGASLLCCLLTAPAPAQPQTVAAVERWAALRGPTHCEAASLALLPKSRNRAQGRASLSFDSRSRQGQLAILLSKPAAPGSSVMLTIGDTPFLLIGQGALAWSRGPAQEAAIIAAIRAETGMRIEARTGRGVRFIDRYDLAGAPTAIDAAAACAAALVNR